MADLRESLDVSLEFPPEALADAEESVRSPRLPDADETAIPFVTIDPPESLDLDQGSVQLTHPAVTAHCEGDLPLGERVSVKLESADVAKRQVRFLLAS